MYTTEQVPAEAIQTDDMILLDPGLVAYPAAVTVYGGMVTMILRHGKTRRFSVGELVTRITGLDPDSARALVSS